MSATSDHRIRLVCKAKPEGGEVEEILKNLRKYGWRIEGSKLFKEPLEAEVVGKSLLGDELVISPKFRDPKAIEEFVKAAIAGCWYIDVYHHLRGEMAKAAAERLGVPFDLQRTVRKKEAGIDLKLEMFPAITALTISYRIGWSEISKGLITKIYERILNEKSRANLLNRLLRWRK